MGDPTTAEGYELKVIAAVVIGGASLSGGEGSILGTIVGALIGVAMTPMVHPPYVSGDEYRSGIVGAIIGWSLGMILARDHKTTKKGRRA